MFGNISHHFAKFHNRTADLIFANIVRICFLNMLQQSNDSKKAGVESTKYSKECSQLPGIWIALVKKLAEMAANVAAPPSTFFRVFLGVLIVSSAVDPKTVNMYFLAEIMYKSLVKKISR